MARGHDDRAPAAGAAAGGLTLPAACLRQKPSVAAMHESPAAQWTVARLARQVNVSGPVPAGRFVAQDGLAPTAWSATGPLRRPAARSGGSSTARPAHGAAAPGCPGRADGAMPAIRDAAAATPRHRTLPAVTLDRTCMPALRPGAAAGTPHLNATLRSLRPNAAILICASIMLTLSLGLRQSLGIFLQPMTRDIAITVSEFTFAIAMQNIAWGIAQPITGALVVRHGFRRIMLAGGLCYLAGLAFLATADGVVGVTIGAGLLIGIALACNASAIANAVASRAVPVTIRSTTLGLVSAAGSLGAMLAAPIGQVLQTSLGWRAGVAGFLVLAIGILPAAWIAGRIDRVQLPPPPPGQPDERDARTMVGVALRHVPFLVMTGAYFVCGMQLVFLTTHLPSYLDICGMDPMLSAQALGMIGGFNILGSLFFGWAGGRWSKQALLGMLYISRSLVLAWFFSAAPTPQTTLLFAGVMGFLWLGVSPLIAGSVAEMFGLRWQAMIQGIAFSSHQIGSFVGAFGGGLVYDTMGSYDLAWRFGVGLGLAAGAAQVAFAYLRPPAALAR